MELPASWCSLYPENTPALGFAQHIPALPGQQLGSPVTELISQRIAPLQSMDSGENALSLARTIEKMGVCASLGSSVPHK